MITWFKRRRPSHRATPVTISTADRIVAAHHHLTPEQWAALPAMAQADMRESVAWEMRAAS